MHVKRVVEAIILAAGRGTRLSPLTDYQNKHLIPIYDKPMIYFSITTAILSGCRVLNIVINEADLDAYKHLERVLNELNVVVNLCVQNPDADGLPTAMLAARESVQTETVLILLADNMVTGHGFIGRLKDGIGTGNVQLFTKKLLDPSAYGVVVRDSAGGVLDLIEKPKVFRSSEVIVGIYCLPSSIAFEEANKLIPSERGETEIVDLLKAVARRGYKIEANDLGRGTVWLDTGTHSNLFLAAEYVRVIQERQAQVIGSIEEAALEMGLVSNKELLGYLNRRPSSEYYLRVGASIRSK